MDFSSGLAKADLKARVITDEGVQAREAELRAALNRWWEQHAALVADLRSTKSLMTVRRTLLESFIAELQPIGQLDRFQLAGVIVRWWNTNQYDLRTLVAHGFTGVGVPPGSDFRSVLAIGAEIQFPKTGSYRLQAELDGQERAVTFRVHGPAPTTGAAAASPLPPGQ